MTDSMPKNIGKRFDRQLVDFNIVKKPRGAQTRWSVVLIFQKKSISFKNI